MKVYRGLAARLSRLAACFATACAFGIASAADDKADTTFKKTERGFGELLKGMGQELKKASDAVVGAAKKQDKKAAKTADKKAD